MATINTTKTYQDKRSKDGHTYTIVAVHTSDEQNTYVVEAKRLTGNQAGCTFQFWNDEWERDFEAI